MKELDEIDHLFRETFDGFEVIPDPSVKEKIDRSIASGKRRRRFLLIFFPLLGLSMTVLAIGMLYGPSGTSTVISRTSTRSVKTEAVYVHTTFADTYSLTVNSSAEKELKRSGNRKKSPGVELQHKTSFRLVEKSDKEMGHEFSGQIVAVSGTDKTGDSSPTEKTESADIAMHVATDSIPDTSNVKTPESLPAEGELLKAPEKNGTGSRWNVTGLAGWEGERAKPVESLNSNELSNVGKEFAGIRSSSLYGKVELNYKLTSGLDLIAGLGFRSTEVQQQATRYVRDSIPEYGDIATSVPTSYTYFAREDQGQQIFRVNSVIMPIGIAGSLSVGRSFVLRCSAGTEFSYGWLNNVQLQPDFNRPVFRPFGWNIWVRPELHYPIGRWRLIAYGTVNQAICQQLRWDVTSKRNPLFGAGIGVSIRL